MRALAFGLLVVAAGGPVHAGTVWCALEDASQRLGFVSDLQREATTTPQDLRKLASRFRRSVNEQFGTAFTGDGGVCRRFPNHPKAESGLATLEADWQMRGYRISTLGVF
jgi:hypothetical protein